MRAKEATLPTLIPRIAAPVITALTAVLLAASATATPPQCVDPEFNTRICQRPGHTQITTTPSAALTDPFPIMYGGFGTGLRGVWNGR